MNKAKFRNGIRHSLLVREKAEQLRYAGRTHREIANELGISLGSADLWTQGIVLTAEQKKGIYARRKNHVWTVEDKQALIRRTRSFWQGKRYTDADLILKIKQFYNKHGRIPLKREFNALRIFREHFGSWNNAIIAAGFEPNPVLFAKKFVAKDGHKCDSFTERIIDDWLSDRRISHERNWKYFYTKMTADFFIEPDVIVEFFGLAGVQKEYDRLVELKRDFCKRFGYRLVEIYPDDIFPEEKNQLEELLANLK
jgi:hypothetical protein